MDEPSHLPPDSSGASPRGDLPEIPDHKLIRQVGRGGCGEVWLAQNALGTHRAIKIVYERTFRHRRPFEREFNGVKKFEPISRLHDGLMDVLQVGRDDAAGYFYCVMELADDVRGGVIDPETYLPRTLAQDAIGGRLPTDECLRIAETIGSALGFLHERGLIHRDVKPSNIVFVNGIPKLADIGLVAEAADAKSFVGTDGFIPPEGPGTVQADLYSLGKVLYEISTGNDRRDYPELPTHYEETVHERELVELNKIVLKACRPDPRERYRSAKEILDDLRAVRRGESVRRRGRRGWVAKMGVGVVFLGAAALLVRQAVTKRRVQVESSRAVTVPEPKAVFIPSGLVAWWRAEEGALDTMSGESDSLLQGASTVSDGKVGRAFRLDGTNDHVRAAYRAELGISGPMTVEAWVNQATNGQSQVILSRWSINTNETDRSYILGCYPDGRVYFAVSSNGRESSTEVVSRMALSLNQWTHVAGTYDGTNVCIHVDGVRQNQAAYAQGIFPGVSAVGIGASVGCSAPGGFAQPFCGRIDEVSVYNRGLTPEEIFAICRAGSAGKRPRPAYQTAPPGLIGWWRGEGDGRDVTENHDGILMNGVSFAPGKIGRAFQFDGHSYVKIPPSDDLNVGKQLTIDFWMKADPDNFMDICCQGLVSSDFYLIGISPGYTWKAGVNFCLITYPEATPPLILPSTNTLAMTSDANEAAQISSGEWHYIAGTYDGTRLQLYVDGKRWGQWMLHPGTIFPMLPGSFLAFGSEAGRGYWPEGQTNRFFRGRLDELRLFNRALSAGEISETFRAVAEPHR